MDIYIHILRSRILGVAGAGYFRGQACIDRHSLTASLCEAIVTSKLLEKVIRPVELVKHGRLSIPADENSYMKDILRDSCPGSKEFSSD